MFCVAIFGLGTLAMAQQVTKSPEDRMQKRLEKQQMHLDKLKQDLGLNDAQVAKIKDLQNREYAQIKSDAENNTLNKKAMLENHNTEMKTILTPDQYTKWQAKRQAKRAEMKEKMQERKSQKMQNTTNP